MQFSLNDALCQIKFKDGDLESKVKVTVTKKLKNMKKIRQKLKYAYFWISFMPSDSLCYYRLMPNIFISYKIQAQKLNDKIWEKMIQPKKKRLPATGLEPGTFCL